MLCLHILYTLLLWVKIDGEKQRLAFFLFMKRVIKKLLMYFITLKINIFCKDYAQMLMTLNRIIIISLITKLLLL